MSNTFVGEGDRLEVTAPTGGITSGQTIVVRSGATGMVGIAVADAAAGETASVDITGIHRVAKDTTTGAGVMAFGDTVYWDVAAAKFSTQVSANVPAGIAAKAAGASDTTVDIRLIPTVK